MLDVLIVVVSYCIICHVMFDWRLFVINVEFEYSDSASSSKIGKGKPLSFVGNDKHRVLLPKILFHLI